MRPQNCRTLLHVSVLAALLLSSNADSEECKVGVYVPRNTKFEVFLGEELRINCTVKFCNDSAPTVSWFKLDQRNVLVDVSSSSSRFRAEWKTLEPFRGVSYLIFKKTVTNDSGEYRCESGSDVGRRITVSVRDHDRPNITTEQTPIKTTAPSPGGQADVWTYAYTAGGIAVFVIVVIVISVVSMRGCKGKPKKGPRDDNQYAAIPMAERPTPQPSPRGSPSVPPSRMSSRRKKPPAQPTESPPATNNDCVYSMLKDGRSPPRNAVQQEEGSVIYAALNHQVQARAPARPRRPKEESSEYAAIRIKDPNFS